MLPQWKMGVHGDWFYFCSSRAFIFCRLFSKISFSRRLLNRFLTTSSIRMTGFVSSRQRLTQRRRREELVQQQASEEYAVEKSAAEQHRRRTEVNSIIAVIIIVIVIISLALKPNQCVKNCIPLYNVNIARSIVCLCTQLLLTVIYSGGWGTKIGDA